VTGIGPFQGRYTENVSSSTHNDRSCVICHATFDAGESGRAVRHCCTSCGHPTKKHSDGMKCSICKNACGIDCRPPAMRVNDPWPIKFPWLT
jgi:hypothetical protein